MTRRECASESEQLAEALDDLISERGVTLDDDRLDWLVEFVAARMVKAQAEALREAALEGAGEVYVGGLPLDAVAVDWLRERSAALTDGGVA